MAALLVRAVLERGLVLEIYEGGVLCLIDGQHNQEIKFSAGAGLDLLTTLERNKDLLQQTAQHGQASLEETYGPAAQHSEHQRGEPISYRMEGHQRSGTIIWVAAAGNVAGIDLPLRYIVAPDVDAGLPDIVFPADIQEDRE